MSSPSKFLKLITIDGPSASGKSSVSRLLGLQLGWPWVSTGAFYRGLALIALDHGAGVEDPDELEKLAQNPEWQVKMTLEDTQVHIGGKNRTAEIAGEKVANLASQISQIPKVRAALLQRQRDCFHGPTGLVAEGRDCGTVVFPQAPVKIYLTASATLRALRRSEEDSYSMEATLEMQKIRDKQDSQRKSAPLKVADGALYIDSSFLTIEEVVSAVLKYAQSQHVPLV